MSVELDLQRPRYEVERIASGWRIREPRGTLLPTIYTDRGQALTRRDSLQAEADRLAKRGPRACMCCGRDFESAGIGNRLCGFRRSRADGTWMTPGNTSTGKVRRAASQP